MSILTDVLILLKPANLPKHFNLTKDIQSLTNVVQSYQPIPHLLIVFCRSGTNKNSFWGKYVPSATSNSPPQHPLFSITACVLTLILFAHRPLHNLLNNAALLFHLYLFLNLVAGYFYIFKCQKHLNKAFSFSHAGLPNQIHLICSRKSFLFSVAQSATHPLWKS